MNLSKQEWLEGLADYTAILVTCRKIFEKIKNCENRSADIPKLKAMINQCKLTSMSTPLSDLTPGAFADSIFGQSLENRRYWEELFKMESFHKTKLKDEIGVTHAHLCNDVNELSRIENHFRTVINAGDDDYIVVKNVVMIFHSSKKTVEMSQFLAARS